MSPEALPDHSVREGFGPDASAEDRVDGPTRERLQRLYGSVNLLADMDLNASADGQYEDIKGVETIIGDLRADIEQYRTAIRRALDTMAGANDEQLGPGGVARMAYAHLWHEYFAIPAGIPPCPDRSPANDDSRLNEEDNRG